MTEDGTAETDIEPDLVALHYAEDPSGLSDASRDRMAAAMGRDRAYVDQLIADMAALREEPLGVEEA